MPLTDADKSQLYSTSFQSNAKSMLGESAFAMADLKTHLDVANYVIGVTSDELAASQKEVADLKEQLASRPPAPSPEEAAAAAAGQATA